MLLHFDIKKKSFPNGKCYTQTRAFPGGTVVKHLPASAGDVRDGGSIPGSGRSRAGGHGNPLRIPAWRTPRTEEPGRLRSTGLGRVGHA